MKVVSIFIFGFLVIVLASYGWGLICNSLFDPDVAFIPSMFGGMVMGWFGSKYLIIDRLKRVPPSGARAPQEKMENDSGT